MAHPALDMVTYIDEETRTKLEALDTETLRSVLRACQVSAVEGKAPGFGSAAKAEGVKKQRALVQALAQPVKRRQAQADWEAMLDALGPEPEPTSVEPPTAPPASAAPELVRPAPEPPQKPDPVEVEEEGSHARTHAHARARESDDEGQVAEADEHTRSDPTEAGGAEELLDENWEEERARLARERAEARRQEEAALVLADMLEEEVLTLQQVQAAVLIAMNQPYGAVARQVNTDPRTLFGWRQEAAFKEAVSRVSVHLAQRLILDMEGAQRLAVATLKAGLDAMRPAKFGMVPDWQARRQCADSILDRGGKLLKGETLQVTQQVTHALDENLEAKLLELQQAQAELEREQMELDTELAELQLLEGGLGDEEGAA